LVVAVQVALLVMAHLAQIPYLTHLPLPAEAVVLAVKAFLVVLAAVVLLLLFRQLLRVVMCHQQVHHKVTTVALAQIMVATY
jgi:hypothetical protein